MLFWAKFPDALAFIFVKTGFYLRPIFSAGRVIAHYRLDKESCPGIHDHYDRLFNGYDHSACHLLVLPAGTDHTAEIEGICSSLAGSRQYLLSCIFNLLHILPE
jgi:hypothetical protein